MYKPTLILIATLLITGCASPAAIDKMTVNPTLKAEPQSTRLKNNILVQSVAGGKSTNPLWISKVGNDGFKQALEDSLRNAALLSGSNASGEFALSAHLLALEQPIAGLDMTVTAAVEYTLSERSTQKVLYSKVISTPFTATFSDAAIGIIRMKVANEGAVRENIQKIINELMVLKLAPQTISINMQ